MEELLCTSILISSFFLSSFSCFLVCCDQCNGCGIGPSFFSCRVLCLFLCLLELALFAVEFLSVLASSCSGPTHCVSLNLYFLLLLGFCLFLLLLLCGYLATLCLLMYGALQLLLMCVALQ